MKKPSTKIFLVLAIFAAVACCAIGFMGGFFNSTTSSSNNLGTYAYECDEHVAFSITPAADLRTIHIMPLHGAYPPETTLLHKPTNSGVRFEGNGVVFVAHGEGVILGEGDDALNCSPVQMPGEAPFNFGD